MYGEGERQRETERDRERGGKSRECVVVSNRTRIWIQTNGRHSCRDSDNVYCGTVCSVASGEVWLVKEWFLIQVFEFTDKKKPSERENEKQTMVRQKRAQNRHTDSGVQVEKHKNQWAFRGQSRPRRLRAYTIFCYNFRRRLWRYRSGAFTAYV